MPFDSSPQRRIAPWPPSQRCRVGVGRLGYGLGMADDPHLPAGVRVGPHTMRAFRRLLLNTLIANVTTSYLWFALTFWAYLETRSVLATSIIGGSFMLLVAVCGTYFGTLVDRHRKKHAMLASSAVTLGAYAAAGVLYLVFPAERLVDWGRPVFWLFAGVVLIGGVVENLRNIALSTTVTLLVPDGERDKANGLVGTVQGVAFLMTSVFSGLSVGLLGMGWTLTLAIVSTAVALLHLLTLSIPEEPPAPDPGDARGAVDVRGAVLAIRAVPGLAALILFSTFNNLVGGVYVALMDPYGLTLFGVEAWGVVLGVTSLGFVIGGLWVARFGLGTRPVRALLQVNLVVAVLGMIFTIRELWWVYALGILLFMCVIPIAEAAEQTIMQRVVPFEKQGRVFGFAQSVEVAASPISAFVIGPVAQYGLIPYMNTDAGRDAFGWLLGEGEARGIALVFLVAGLVMAVVVLLALLSPPYRRLSGAYAAAAPPEGSPGPSSPAG